MTPQQIISEIEQHKAAGAKVELAHGQEYVDTPIRVAPVIDAIGETVAKAFSPSHRTRTPIITGYERTNLRWRKLKAKERKSFLLAQKKKWSGDDAISVAVRAQCDALLAEMK